MMNDPARGRDPHDNVMKEGGPYHVRGKLESYISRLKKLNRSSLAERLAEKHHEENSYSNKFRKPYRRRFWMTGKVPLSKSGRLLS